MIRLDYVSGLNFAPLPDVKGAHSYTECEDYNCEDCVDVTQDEGFVGSFLTQFSLSTRKRPARSAARRIIAKSSLAAGK